jgi:hypothetical protein
MRENEWAAARAAEQLSSAVRLPDHGAFKSSIVLLLRKAASQDETTTVISSLGWTVEE